MKFIIVVTIIGSSYQGSNQDYVYGMDSTPYVMMKLREAVLYTSSMGYIELEKANHPEEKKDD